MTRLRLFLALGATALSFATATAQASPTNWNHHGTVCVPSTSAGAASTVYNSFGVNNVSTSATLNVQCPLITTSVLDGVHVNSVIVRFADRGATRLTCTIRNTDINANVVYTETKPSPGFSTGFQTIEFDPPTGVSTSTNGFWEVECTIPAVNSGNYSAVTAMFMSVGS